MHSALLATILCLSVALAGCAGGAPSFVTIDQVRALTGIMAPGLQLPGGASAVDPDEVLDAGLDDVCNAPWSAVRRRLDVNEQDVVGGVCDRASDVQGRDAQ